MKPKPTDALAAKAAPAPNERRKRRDVAIEHVRQLFNQVLDWQHQKAPLGEFVRAQLESVIEEAQGPSSAEHAPAPQPATVRPDAPVHQSSDAEKRWFANREEELKRWEREEPAPAPVTSAEPPLREPEKVEYIADIGSGRPTLRGIRVEVICQRFLAGETIAELAYDYGLLEQETEEAIRHQIKVWRRKAPAALRQPGTPAISKEKS